MPKDSIWHNENRILQHLQLQVKKVIGNKKILMCTMHVTCTFFHQYCILILPAHYILVHIYLHAHGSRLAAFATGQMYLSQSSCKMEQNSALNFILDMKEFLGPHTSHPIWKWPFFILIGSHISQHPQIINALPN